MISDTHGYVDAWQKATGILGEIDILIHTGDILSSGPFNPRYEGYQPAELASALNNAPFPIVFAKGNCDAEIDTLALNYPIESPYALIDKGGVSILATHGHLYEEDALAEMGSRYKVDIIVRGHTHHRGVKKFDRLTIVNPGSVALPKNPDGIPSAAVVELGENKVIRLLSIDDGSVLEESTL
jgi:putative phosphoesterase